MKITALRGPAVAFVLGLAAFGFQEALSPASAHAAPVLLAEFDFDDGAGGSDPQGWRPLTAYADEEAYFHVEDFSGEGHTASALAGTASMWCGLTAEDPRTCHWQTPPGYGNSWRQNLSSVAFAVQGDVTLAFLMDVGIEDAYDFVFVQYESITGEWVTLDSYSCGFFTLCGPMTPSYTVPAADHDGTLRFRFFFSSDGAISSEQNYGIEVHKAFVLDNLVVSDGTGVVDFQDFESESINAAVTTDGHWYAEVNTDERNTGGLVNGGSVLQESASWNQTYLWAFLEGSTADYGCAGHPEQAVTPQARSIIRSPRIDLLHDVDGHPVTGPVDSILVSFDVYRDIPEDQPKSYTTVIVSYSDCLEGWVRGFHRGAQKDWYRHTVVVTPPVGTTEIEVELGVDNSSPDGSTCVSHSPLFDNVTVERFGGVVTAVSPSELPGRRMLSQNHPNPFNPITVIEYEVPAGGERVRLRVFDASGRVVRTLVDAPQPAGSARVRWDGTDADGRGLASGVYFYELSAGAVRETRRMVLLK